MRVTWTVVSVTAVALVAAGPVLAGQHGHAPAPKAHGHATAPTPTSTTTSNTSKRTATTMTGTTPTTPVNPIAAKISSHPQLLAKVNSLLTASGTKLTLNQASTGFKNQGQLIAALHVSQNLGLSFDALRTDMVKRHMSLGQAIQDVKHTSATTATRQATQAEQEADHDVKTSTSATTLRTTKTPTTKKPHSDK